MTSEAKSKSATVFLYTDPFNKRVRVDDYVGHVQDVLELIWKAIPDWAEKLIVKSRENEIPFFLANGFSQEAFVPGYFNGQDMYFMVQYYTVSRSSNNKHAEEQDVVKKILKEERKITPVDCRDVSLATSNDAYALARLYATVFQVYPTPLNDPAYVRKTLEEGTIYVVIRDNDKIISAASAEVNRQYFNAELTDCATWPEAQGKGHIKKLLSKLEAVLGRDKIQCLYTIARAESYSMNKVFYQLNYSFGGTLVNNCFIYSGLEDMNVWYKTIQ